MTNGSVIFLGSWEAALAVCEGGNPLMITCLVETRDGTSEQQDRNGYYHAMAPPGGVTHLKVPASRLSCGKPTARSSGLWACPAPACSFTARTGATGQLR
jgi:hypothetical protein